MKKITLIILFALFVTQTNASMRCAWLETKAAFTNDAMLAADQASKETFCKLGNQFIKYADAYIDECKGESNLGMQGTMGMMINNKQIVQEKCRGYTRTVSDDVKDWMDNNTEKTSSTPAATNQLSDAEKRELEELRREKSERERSGQESQSTFGISNEKDIFFSERGIDIHVTYPNIVQPGKHFTITAKMTNKYQNAKQGGLTLSFPDFDKLRGDIKYNSFSRIDGYEYPAKVYNKQIGKALPVNYYMVEGWQSKKWPKGSTKQFTVDFIAPEGYSNFRVNIRAVLWIKSKNDTIEIPLYGSINDQQGYGVKQFTININSAGKEQKATGGGHSSTKGLKQGIPYSKARKILIDNGWQGTYSRWQDISPFATEKDFYNNNDWREVESCSQGVQYCVFNFHDEYGNQLTVTTIGENDDPDVYSWEIKK